MKKYFVILNILLAFAPTVASACETYSCTVWYYTCGGGGTTSCSHAHENGVTTCAYSSSEAASRLKSSSSNITMVTGCVRKP